MRPKELCFLVAFHTTTEALALEEAARSADVQAHSYTHSNHSGMRSGVANAHRRERKNEKPIDKMRLEIRKYI